MKPKSAKEISATRAEYNRILSLIDSLNKHAHYKADFIIRIIKEKTDCWKNRHEFVFHPVVEGRVCSVCGRPEKENLLT
jgi:hypothetical protein